jgi:4-hydroxy-tetrahydrodipicolinate synthase
MRIAALYRLNAYRSNQTPPASTGFFVVCPVARQAQDDQDMQTTHSTQGPTPRGVWLPLITPFCGGRFDEASGQRLAAHYVRTEIDGIILGATTGEGLTIDDDELASYIDICRAAIVRAGRSIQLYLGISGSNTRKLVAALAHTASWPIDGYLIPCPYYTRPSQLGLLRHFSALADAATKPMMLYNIPYRTGVNLLNPTMRQLAEHPNIVGVKDCCADAAQSFDLLRDRPAGFSVLTGEDALFYAALTQGADGGILAAAHVETAEFIAVRRQLIDGDQRGALARWRELVELARLLFAEPSPAPIKYWLWRVGLIDSPQVRLPMTEVSEGLGARIDSEIAARRERDSARVA